MFGWSGSSRAPAPTPTRSRRSGGRPNVASSATSAAPVGVTCSPRIAGAPARIGADTRLRISSVAGAGSGSGPWALRVAPSVASGSAEQCSAPIASASRASSVPTMSTTASVRPTSCTCTRSTGSPCTRASAPARRRKTATARARIPSGSAPAPSSASIPASVCAGSASRATCTIACVARSPARRTSCADNDHSPSGSDRSGAVIASGSTPRSISAPSSMSPLTPPGQSR